MAEFVRDGAGRLSEFRIANLAKGGVSGRVGASWCNAGTGELLRDGVAVLLLASICIGVCGRGATVASRVVE